MKWAWTILIDLGKQCKRWGDTDFGPASTAQLVRNPFRTGLDGWQLLGLREERKEGTKWYKVIQSHPQANVQPWSSKFQISYAHSWSFSTCRLGSFTLISVETHILLGTVYLDCLEVFLLITLGKMDASIKQLGQTWHSRSAQLQQLWAQVGLAVGGWRPGGNIKRSSGGGGGRGRGQGQGGDGLFGIPLDYENPVPYI